MDRRYPPQARGWSVHHPYVATPTRAATQPRAESGAVRAPARPSRALDGRGTAPGGPPGPVCCGGGRGAPPCASHRPISALERPSPAAMGGAGGPLSLQVSTPKKHARALTRKGAALAILARRAPTSVHSPPPPLPPPQPLGAGLAPGLCRRCCCGSRRGCCCSVAAAPVEGAAAPLAASPRETREGRRPA